MDRQAPLRKFLASFSERRFLFVRPGGNWGDHLIYYGAEQLADDLALTWEWVDSEEAMISCYREGDVIFLVGGGGFTMRASGRAASLLAAALTVPGAIVAQGPCTVDTEKDINFLADAYSSGVAASFTFFARERQTADIVEGLLPREAELFVNEDTAFYATRESLLQRARYASRRVNLLAIREDTEAVACSGNREVSGVILDPATYASSFDHWIRIHVAARSILTNRTHSAICGAILGTPTTMYAGAYHKNRSIWEYSLSDRGVDWLHNHDGLPIRPPFDPLLRWAPDRIRYSWKVTRALYRLRGVPTR